MVMLELTKKTIRTSMEVMVKDLVTRKKKYSWVLWNYERDSREDTFQEEGKLPNDL